MSKQRLPRDFKASEIFRVQLSIDELNYIANTLPAGYSFMLQPKKNIPKHIIQAAKRRAVLSQNEDSNSHPVNINKGSIQNHKKLSIPVQPQKINSTQKLGSAKISNSTNSSNKWIDQLNQNSKKAARVLIQLKSHKCSWPFHEPVDAEALQIPEYYEIIKEPMDLQTIENKIKNEKYSDFSQFHADIMKIIQNSYRFNEANEDYLKITSQFENYFTKLSQQTQEVKPNNKNSKKKKKSSVNNKEFNDAVPVTLMEKKLLSQQIRRLGKEHMKSIYAIVFDNSEQHEEKFDLQKLSQKKLRQLQKFMRNRIIFMQQKARSNQLEKNQLSHINNFEQSSQSSFLTDSSEDE